MTDWHGKPYYSLDAYCKNTFHRKCYKIALNAHMTCPNRDGTLDVRGCIFCKDGSGEYAVEIPAADHGKTTSSPVNTVLTDIDTQLQAGIDLFGSKTIGESFIAYFQAYTNTYAPLPYLESVYRSALEHPKVCGISIATRPDCLGKDVLLLLERLRMEYPTKFIWMELGLQTIHEKTAAYIRRGYSLPVFENAFQALSAAEFPVIVHVILGLPGENDEMQLQTIEYLNRFRPFGIKLQLLHVLQGTELAVHYNEGGFEVFTQEEYLALLTRCIARLHPDIVIHRLTGDGAKKDLIAPLWSINKREVLNSLHHKLKIEGIRQGMDLA